MSHLQVKPEIPRLSKVDLYLCLLLHKWTDLHYMNNSTQESSGNVLTKQEIYL